MNDGDIDLEAAADGTAAIKDEQVYRGFVGEFDDDETTYDYGETPVMLTPVGEFQGSTPEGGAITEKIDADSLTKMAEQTEEILLDRDHASMRKTAERDTSALGWISNLKAVTDAGDMSGLYGVIRWTAEGLRLAKDRVYRFLSPVFELDAAGRAVKLVNVALTNRPALRMPPILNGEAEQKTISITEKDSRMNEEDIVKLVEKTVATILDKKAEKPEEKPEEKQAEQPEEPEKEKTDETDREAADGASAAGAEDPAASEQAEEMKEEAENGCGEKEEKEEKKPAKNEVVKEEILNSIPSAAPVAVDTESMSYDELKAYMRKNGMMW